MTIKNKQKSQNNFEKKLNQKTYRWIQPGRSTQGQQFIQDAL